MGALINLFRIIIGLAIGLAHSSSLKVGINGFVPHVCLAPQLVRKGDINYLVADYLSEITMSLLVAAKRKSPVRRNIVCSQ